MIRYDVVICKSPRSILKVSVRSGAMDQCFTAPVALPKEQGSISRTLETAHNCL